MKKQINENGFGKAEIIICLCALLVFMAIGIKSLSENKDSSKFSLLKKQAENFAYKVMIYKDKYTRVDNIYYLDYLLDDGYAIEVIDPFNENMSCDRYESFVEIDGNEKIIELKCGNYLISGVLEEDFTVFRLSEWQENAANGEMAILYNYSKDNTVVNSSYMLENQFIDVFNSNENYSIENLDEFTFSNIELLSKVFYREKQVVKEFKK